MLEFCFFIIKVEKTVHKIKVPLYLWTGNLTKTLTSQTRQDGHQLYKLRCR